MCDVNKKTKDPLVRNYKFANLQKRAKSSHLKNNRLWRKGKH